MKKVLFRNVAKFIGKHLCQSLSFNEVTGPACNFIKKDTLAQVLSCKFCEISKNNFPYRTPHRTPPVAASGVYNSALVLAHNKLCCLICIVNIKQIKIRKNTSKNKCAVINGADANILAVFC